MRTLCVWLVLVGGVAAEEIPKHLSETIYEGEIAKAKAEYLEKVHAASLALKDRLENASNEATKRGELDKAVAYRDRAKAAESPPADETPLLGKYEFKWANNTSYQRIFQADGVVTAGNDRKSFVLWKRLGEDVSGLMYWDGAIEAISVSKGKITLLHFPKNSAIKGMAEKVK